MYINIAKCFDYMCTIYYCVLFDYNTQYKVYIKFSTAVKLYMLIINYIQDLNMLHNIQKVDVVYFT